MRKYLFFLFFVSMLNAQTIEEGLALKAQMKYDQALNVFEKSDDENKYLYMAEVYDLQELYNQAVINLQKHIDKNKNDRSAKIYLGQLFFKAKQYKWVISTFEKLADEDNNDHTFYTLGLAYQETIQFDKAQLSFNKTLEINPNHLKALYKIGVFYAQIQEYKKANDMIQKGLTLSPMSIDFLSLKAQVDYATEQWGGCISSVEILSNLGYKTENLYFMMAKSYSKIQQYRNAIDYLNFIIEEFETNNANVYFHLGLNYGYNKQYDLAEKNFLTAIDMNKYTFENEYYYLGEFTKENNPKKALNYFKKSIAEKPDMFFSHYQILLLELEKKDNKTQLKLLENFKAKHKNIEKTYADFIENKIAYLKREIHLE